MSWWCHQMETFFASLALCVGNSRIHRSPVNSPHKGQWRGALMFSLICIWINGLVNNREAGDLRCHHSHYDITIMCGDCWGHCVWSSLHEVIVTAFNAPVMIKRSALPSTDFDTTLLVIISLKSYYWVMWVILGHYNDVIMSAMASQITGFSVVCSTVGLGVDQRKYQSSVSLAFVRGIHQWPVNSPQKRPVTWKIFPFDEVIMGEDGLANNKEIDSIPAPSNAFCLKNEIR